MDGTGRSGIEWVESSLVGWRVVAGEPAAAAAVVARPGQARVCAMRQVTQKYAEGEEVVGVVQEATDKRRGGSGARTGALRLDVLTP